jgi:hypothetical protein
MQAQPDDSACGPTCLHAVYRYFGSDCSLESVVGSVLRVHDDETNYPGTLAVMLGNDALNRGYDASLCTFNLQVFDPTWFTDSEAPGDPVLLTHKLHAQMKAKQKQDPRFGPATEAYIEFLELGGQIYFRDLSSRLLASYIRAGLPILTGLSATYLYRCAREWGPNDDYDDIRGIPSGHFVVIDGYDPARRLVSVADPLADNPAMLDHKYTVPMSRLVAAIMLGVLTYDANLLVIRPGAGTLPDPPEDA